MIFDNINLSKETIEKMGFRATFISLINYFIKNCEDEKERQEASSFKYHIFHVADSDFEGLLESGFIHDVKDEIDYLKQNDEKITLNSLVCSLDIMKRIRQCGFAYEAYMNVGYPSFQLSGYEDVFFIENKNITKKHILNEVHKFEYDRNSISSRSGNVIYTLCATNVFDTVVTKIISSYYKDIIVEEENVHVS